MSCFCDRIIIGVLTWEVKTLSCKSIDTPTGLCSTWAIPWQLNILLHPSCCQTLQVSGSFRCLDDPYVPHLASFHVTQEHLHAKAILEEALRNWWWFLHPQPVHPVTLAILPLSFLLTGWKKGMSYASSWLGLEHRGFLLWEYKMGEEPSLTK